MSVTVGSGAYTYEVAEGWGTLPKGYEWGQVSAVVVDSQDRVYTFSRTNHPLMVFDRDGNFLESWGEDIFEDPHGLCIDAQDNVYMIDRKAQVAGKYTLDRQKLLEVGTRGQPSDTGWTEENETVLRAAGPFHHPTDAAAIWQRLNPRGQKK